MAASSSSARARRAIGFFGMIKTWGFNISNSDAGLVFVKDGSGYLAMDDFFKDRFGGHGLSVKPKGN